MKPKVVVGRQWPKQRAKKIHIPAKKTIHAFDSSGLGQNFYALTHMINLQPDIQFNPLRRRLLTL